jgi:hypothetical protein
MTSVLPASSYCSCHDECHAQALHTEGIRRLDMRVYNMYFRFQSSTILSSSPAYIHTYMHAYIQTKALQSPVGKKREIVHSSLARHDSNNNSYTLTAISSLSSQLNQSSYNPVSAGRLPCHLMQLPPKRLTTSNASSQARPRFNAPPPPKDRPVPPFPCPLSMQKVLCAVSNRCIRVSRYQGISGAS